MILIMFQIYYSNVIEYIHKFTWDNEAMLNMYNLKNVCWSIFEELKFRKKCSEKGPDFSYDHFCLLYVDTDICMLFGQNSNKLLSIML